MQKQVFRTVVQATGDEPSIVISTAAEDRDSDVVVPEGAVTASYQKNPVVLFGHDYSSIPVGATTSMSVTPDGIQATWRWLEGDEWADRVRNAFNQGVIRAASVGFRPLEWQPRPDGFGKTFSKWELLEWSLVPVPANPEAVRQLKAYGLWSDALEKAGRALSRDNEAHLRASLDHVTQCADHLGQVLDCIKDEDDGDDDGGDDDKSYSYEEIAAACKSAAGDLTRRMQKHTHRRVVDLDGGVLDVTPADVRAATAEVMDQMRRDLAAHIAKTVIEEIQSAVNRSRGRLD